MDPGVIVTSTFAFFFRVFVAQPFSVPSSAMAPTLEPGDYLWASKFAYGYSNFSLPFGHILPTFTYAKSAPRRGDVVVFRLPSDPSVEYIMRIVGLPGDKVQLKGGITYLNGTALAQTEAGSYPGGADFEGGKLLIEKLPDGRQHTILDSVDDPFMDNAGAVTVPSGHYFVMGDNRDNANDSRFGVGFVPEANIVAKVLVAVTWPGGKFTMREVK